MWHPGFSKVGLVVGLGLLSMLGAGCATSRAPGTRPDDMSRAEHLKAARRYEADAAKHQGRYDPNAEITVVTPWVSDPHTPGSSATRTTEIIVENPTAKHLEHARRRRDIARQHAAAARALKQYADKYCKSVPVAERKAHPLPGRYSRVEDIPGGVRLYLKKGVKGVALRDRMACHIAQARMEGFAGHKDCPLHLRGIRFRVAQKGIVIELLARRAGMVSELRRRARAHTSH